jgi:hypothetical protein
MRRFERRVVGGSPAARSTLFAELPASGHPLGSPSLCSGCAVRAPRSISAWPRSSCLRLLSGSTQVQILPRGLFGGETGRGAGTRLKRIGRPRAAGEHHLSPPPFFRRVKPRSAVIGWKPFRAARPVGQDHCSPPLWRVNPPRCGRCFEIRWIGSAGWGASPPLSANFSSCSSKAEQSADNRSTPERYRARGPFSWRANSESREPRC